MSKNTDSKNSRKMYRIKEDSIFDAVIIIEQTKTQAVKYEIGFDENKSMYYITFTFKSAPYVKYDSVCFHMTNNLYRKIESLKK